MRLCEVPNTAPYQPKPPTPNKLFHSAHLHVVRALDGSLRRVRGDAQSIVVLGLRDLLPRCRGGRLGLRGRLLGGLEDVVVVGGEPAEVREVLAEVVVHPFALLSVPPLPLGLVSSSRCGRAAAQQGTKGREADCEETCDERRRVRVREI